MERYSRPFVISNHLNVVLVQGAEEREVREHTARGFCHVIALHYRENVQRISRLKGLELWRLCCQSQSQNTCTTDNDKVVHAGHGGKFSPRVLPIHAILLHPYSIVVHRHTTFHQFPLA